MGGAPNPGGVDPLCQVRPAIGGGFYCTIPLPHSFLPHDGLAVRGKGWGPNPEAAKEAAACQVLTKLLQKHPYQVRLLDQDWHGGADGVREHVAQGAYFVPSTVLNPGSRATPSHRGQWRDHIPNADPHGPRFLRGSAAKPVASATPPWLAQRQQQELASALPIFPLGYLDGARGLWQEYLDPEVISVSSCDSHVSSHSSDPSSTDSRITLLSWNAGNILRRGMDVNSGVRMDSYIGEFLAGRYHIGIVQEAQHISQVQPLAQRGFVVCRSRDQEHAFILGGRGNRSVSIVKEACWSSPYAAKANPFWALSWCLAHIHFGTHRDGSTKMRCLMSAVKAASVHMESSIAREKRDVSMCLLRRMWRVFLDEQTIIVTGDFNACARLPTRADNFAIRALVSEIGDADITFRVLEAADEDVCLAVFLVYDGQQERFPWKLAQSVACRHMQNYSLRLTSTDIDWHHPLYVTMRCSTERNRSTKRNRAPESDVARKRNKRAKYRERRIWRQLAGAGAGAGGGGSPFVAGAGAGAGAGGSS